MMKFKTTKEEFLPLVAAHRTLVRNRVYNQDYSLIVMEVKDDGTLTMATRLEGQALTLISTLQTGEGAEAGLVGVEVARLYEYLDTLPATDVTVEQLKEKRAVKVSGKTGNAIFPVFEPHDFRLDSGEELLTEPQSVSLDAEQFVNALKNVAFATDTDELRPVLKKILLEFKEDGITAVATDRNRVCMDSVACSVPYPGTSVLVPAADAKLLVNVCTKRDTLTVTRSEQAQNVTVYEAGPYKVVSSDIPEGKFPNYRSVFSQKNEFTVKVTRDELLSAIKIVGTMKTVSSPILKLTVERTLTESTLELNVMDASFKQAARQQVKCESDNDEPVIVALIHQKFQEIIEHIKEDTIILKITDGKKPVLILSENEDGTLTERSVIAPIAPIYSK